MSCSPSCTRARSRAGPSRGRPASGGGRLNSSAPNAGGEGEVVEEVVEETVFESYDEVRWTRCNLQARVGKIHGSFETPDDLS